MVIIIVLIVFIRLEQTNKLESNIKVWEDKDFCNALMPSENKILESNQNRKSDKAPFIIYADLESVKIIEKNHIQQK